MKRKKVFIYTLACFLIFSVFYASAPFFGTRYIPTHDGEYHIIRIVEFSKMLSAGYLFPRWAPTLNSGYGIPVFQYNYPFPNYVGSMIRFFTHDAVYAYQYSMGAGYLLLTLAMYLWLRSFFGMIPALSGTAVGSFVPYMFVDLYIRGSIGEIWATVFLFFALFFIRKKFIAATTLAYACLILSHNILAMVYTPFLIAYCYIVDKKLLISLIGGVGVSAFFWLPAILERKYVTGLNTVNFREHFVQMYEFLIPSWGSQFSGSGSFGNKISFQIGIVPLLSVAGALLSLKKAAYKEEGRRLLWLMIVVVVFSIFLMSAISGPLWELLPLMQNIQYPWRLLSFVIPISSFCAAYWVSTMKRQKAGALLAFFAIVAVVSYVRPVTYEPRDEAYYLARKNFTSGTSSMGNSFSSVWTTWKTTKPEASVSVTGGRVIKQTYDRYLDKEFDILLDSAGIIDFHTLYFPGWKAYADGNEIPIDYKKDGIIRVHITPGNHTVRIIFTETPIRNVANGISIVSLVALLAWGILRLYERSH